MSDSVTPWTPRFPAFRYLLEFAHTHVHGASDAIQPSHPLLPPLISLSLILVPVPQEGKAGI